MFLYTKSCLLKTENKNSPARYLRWKEQILRFKNKSKYRKISLSFFLVAKATLEWKLNSIEVLHLPLTFKKVEKAKFFILIFATVGHFGFVFLDTLNLHILDF